MAFHNIRWSLSRDLFKKKNMSIFLSSTSPIRDARFASKTGNLRKNDPEMCGSRPLHLRVSKKEIITPAYSSDFSLCNLISGL
uniref:Uncharacterized protein n=1 Tax=Ascaris lumbricoides TaxID=6252 RepID=A0A9J2P1J7_ASCLU